MANYLLAFHGGGMPESEAEQQRVLAEWGVWYGNLGPAVVDGGKPVSQTRTIGSAGGVSPGGGANPVSGYTIIAARQYLSGPRQSFADIGAAGGDIGLGDREPRPAGPDYRLKSVSSSRGWLARIHSGALSGFEASCLSSAWS